MDKTSAMIITIFLGYLGIQRFMTKKTVTAILWLLTGGCFLVGWIYDIVKVSKDQFKMKDGSDWITE